MLAFQDVKWCKQCSLKGNQSANALSQQEVWIGFLVKSLHHLEQKEAPSSPPISDYMNGRLNHRAAQTHVNRKISLFAKTSSVGLGVSVHAHVNTWAKGGKNPQKTKFDSRGTLWTCSDIFYHLCSLPKWSALDSSKAGATCSLSNKVRVKGRRKWETGG